MGGATAGIDVDPIWLAEQKVAVRPQFFKNMGGCGTGRTVGTIHGNAQAIQWAHGGSHMAGILFTGAFFLPQDAADGAVCSQRSIRGIVDQRFHLGFQLIGELAAVSAENFDAVVFEGVVRSRDHNACIGMMGQCQKGYGGCGDHTQQYSICPGGTNAGGQGSFQHLARNAGIPPDEDLGPVAQCPGEHRGSGKAGLISQKAIQFPIDDTADPIGAKIFTHNGHFPFSCITMSAPAGP